MPGTRRTSRTAILHLEDLRRVSAARGRPIASAAFLAGDLAVLNDLWSEDYIVNSPLQKVVDKPQLLELVRSGRVRHGTYEAQIERMVRHGNVVIVMGRDTVTDPPDGTVSRRRYTNVWRLHDGIWKSIARHANVLPRDAPGGP